MAVAHISAQWRSGQTSLVWDFDSDSRPFLTKEGKDGFGARWKLYFTQRETVMNDEKKMATQVGIDGSPSTDPCGGSIGWVRIGRVDFFMGWRPREKTVEFTFTTLEALKIFATDAKASPLLILDLHPPPQEGASVSILLRIHEEERRRACKGFVQSHSGGSNIRLSGIPSELCEAVRPVPARSPTSEQRLGRSTALSSSNTHRTKWKTEKAQKRKNKFKKQQKPRSGERQSAAESQESQPPLAKSNSPNSLENFLSRSRSQNAIPDRHDTADEHQEPPKQHNTADRPKPSEPSLAWKLKALVINRFKGE